MSTLKDEIVNNKYIIISVTLLVTLIVIFFSNLYLTIHRAYLPFNKEDKEKESLFFKRLKYIIILFFFLISLIVLYIVNPYDVITKYFGTVILISIFIGTIILIMLSWYNYSYKKGYISASENTHTPMSYFKRIFLFLLFSGISGVIIYFLIFLIDPISSYSDLVSFLLNLLIIIIILSLVYKVFNINNNSNLFTFIINIIFTIKTFIFNKTTNFISKNHSSTSDPNTTTYIILIILTIFLMLFYFKLSFFEKKVNLQGGKQIINMPINTDNMNILASYEKLNGSNHFEYQYAISFWVFINSYPPSTNFSHDTFVSILNYGDKPNILFNISKNTLMITMKQNNTSEINMNSDSIELDDNGNRIIYTYKNFLLQKWNNIIINYTGGTLDIFLNGELVKSTNGILPYMKLDNLSIGTNKGIGGGICNLVYFNKSLTSSNIYYIYNMVKNKSPPVTENSTETIMKLL